MDTDRVPAFDSRVGDLVQNEAEGKLIYQLVQALLRSGTEERQIGIMSLYRQQIKLLSYLLQDKKHIEILTADKSQGRDKDCVIISMVRSNDHGQVRPRRSRTVVSVLTPHPPARSAICSKIGDGSMSPLRVHSPSW